MAVLGWENFEYQILSTQYQTTDRAQDEANSAQADANDGLSARGESKDEKCPRAKKETEGHAR